MIYLLFLYRKYTTLTQVSKNFSIKELACPCCGEIDMNSFFVKALQLIRNDMGIPFVITSGYRCADYNKVVKGANKSKHLIGMAVDISTANWTSENIHDFLYYSTSFSERTQTKDLGFTGVGIYPHHIHFDLRYDSNAAWVAL